MTRANNLSMCADCGAQLTFSTIAKLQLSVHWPNPIESPYGHSNVIFQAFILCLQLHGEGPPKRWHLNRPAASWRAAIEQRRQGANVWDRERRQGLNGKCRRQGTGHAEVKWFYMACCDASLCTAKHHWAFAIDFSGVLTYVFPLKVTAGWSWVIEVVC